MQNHKTPRNVCFGEQGLFACASVSCCALGKTPETCVWAQDPLQMNSQLLPSNQHVLLRRTLQSASASGSRLPSVGVGSVTTLAFFRRLTVAPVGGIMAIDGWMIVPPSPAVCVASASLFTTGDTATNSGMDPAFAFVGFVRVRLCGIRSPALSSYWLPPYDGDNGGDRVVGTTGTAGVCVALNIGS